MFLELEKRCPDGIPRIGLNRDIDLSIGLDGVGETLLG